MAMIARSDAKNEANFQAVLQKSTDEGILNMSALSDIKQGTSTNQTKVL
jgi:hypothetical protein